MTHWEVRAHHSAGDGTALNQCRRYRRRPSVQTFPDGRALVTGRDGSRWHLNGVDWIDRVPPRRPSWLLLVGAVWLGWRLLVRAAERYEVREGT